MNQRVYELLNEKAKLADKLPSTKKPKKGD
jgi:hypothetical protein